MRNPEHDYADGEDGGSSEVGGEDYSMDAPTIKPGYICLGFFLKIIHLRMTSIFSLCVKTFLLDMTEST